MLVCERTKVTTKVWRELHTMSLICYPHGEPSLISMEKFVSTNNYDFVEDELLQIIFQTDK